MSNKFRRIIFVALFTAVSALAGSLINAESTYAASPCVVTTPSDYTVNPDKTITATFVVSGDAGCTQPVTLMTWYADSTLYPKPEFWTTQKIYDTTIKTFPVGSHTMTTKLPLCTTDPNYVHSYQADVIATDKPSPVLTPPNTGSFYDQLQANGLSIVVSSKVAPGVCPATPPVVDPPKPPTVVPPTVTQPLPKTGSGSVVGIFLATTVVSTVLYQLATRRQSV